MPVNDATTAAELAELWNLRCLRRKFGAPRDFVGDVTDEMTNMIEMGFSVEELRTAILAKRDRCEQLWQFRERLKLSKFGRNGSANGAPTMADMLAARRNHTAGD